MDWNSICTIRNIDIDTCICMYLCIRTVCSDTTRLNYVHEYLFIRSAMAIRDKLILSKMRKFSPSLIVEGPNVECSSVIQER
jgi:hypothetical protein